MKKDITLKDVKSISHDDLSKLIFDISSFDKTTYKKVEKLLLKNDPKKLYKSINKDISSIKRGRKFIDYRDSFEFSIKIQTIVEDIISMVEDDRDASKLLKELILTDSKVYLRSDDSAGAIQNSYALAEDEWKRRAVLGLSKDELLKDIEDLLICDGFGMREIFSEEFPKSLYEKLYKKVMKLYREENDSYERSSLYHILLTVAHYLRSPKLYIETKELKEDELLEHDFLDIANEYKYVNDAKNTLHYLS